MNTFTLFLSTIIVCYIIGKFIERLHFHNIQKREKRFKSLSAFTTEKSHTIDPTEEMKMVYGNIVIGIDYYKRVIGFLRKIRGGPLRTHERVIERARREAILRMKNQAYNWGAYKIINMRIETSAIGSTQYPSTEIYVYATGIKRKNTHQLTYITSHTLQPNTPS